MGAFITVAEAQGALTLVLGTHCKTEFGICGCQHGLGQNKGGGAVIDPRFLRRGLLERAFSVGAVDLACLVQGKHLGLALRTTAMPVGCHLMHQKQGAVNQQG